MKKPLKIILVIFSILLVLIICLLIAGFIYLKNFDIKKFKPQIVQAVSEVLKRPVDFKDIDLQVSLKEGVRLHLTDLIINENPEFGTGNFVSVAEINAQVNILPFIHSREISIPGISILSPQITIIRNPDGKLNVQTIGQAEQNPSTGSSPSAAISLPVILMDSFHIENAQVHFIDKSGVQEIALEINQLNIDLHDFSLNKPFRLLMEAAILSAQNNFHSNGEIRLDLLAKGAQLTDFFVELDLSQTDLAAVRALPELKGVPLPQILTGKFKTKIKEASLDEKGLKSLVLDVGISDGRIMASQIAPGISVEVNALDFVVGNFSLNTAAPFNVKLKAALYQDQPNIDFYSSVLFDSKTMDVELTDGKFTTDLGLWPWEKIKASVVSLKDVPLPTHLTGIFETTIKNLKASPAGLKSILVDAKLKAGEIVLENVVPNSSLALNQINLAVSDFSLGKPFQVSLETAYLSEVPNISFNGQVTYDLNTQAAVIRNAVFGLDLNKLSLEDLKTSGLVPPNVPFPQTLGGKVEARLSELSVGPAGLGNIKMDIDWEEGDLAIAEIAPGISVTLNSIALRVKDFSLNNPFLVDAAFGFENDLQNVFFKGLVNFDQATQNIHLSQSALQTDLSQIPLARLKTTILPLKDVPLPDVLKGQMDVSLRELSAGPQGVQSIDADVFLKEGEVSMKEVSPGISFAASHINATFSHLSIGSPFDFNIQLAYLNSEPNIQTHGRVKWMEDQSFEFIDTSFNTDLSTFDLKTLKSSISSLKDVPLPETLQGKLKLTISDAAVGAAGLLRLSSKGSLRDWAIKLPELAVPVKGSDTTFALTQTDFSLNKTIMSLGKGQITVQMDMKDYLKRQDFLTSFNLKDIDVVEILDQTKSPVKVEGLISGTMKAQGQITDMNSIVGDGTFEVRQAKLIDLNILKLMLDKISFLPNVSARVEASLSDRYKEKLKTKDTRINKIAIPLVISSGVISLDPVEVEADEFIFTGKCLAGFDQKYSLDGFFKIPAELSSAMAQGLNELQYLFDEGNNISLPVHVTGQGANPPVVSVKQTAIDVGKNALKQQGAAEMGKVLDKLLGVEEEPTSPNGQPHDPAVPSENKKSPGTQLFEGLLKDILK